MLKIGNQYFGSYINENYKDAYVNEGYKGIQFIKFLNDDSDLILGLNVDASTNEKPFLTSLTPLQNDFYETSDCHLYLKRFSKEPHTHIAIIEIPSDAIVQVYENHYSADKIIITEIIPFQHVNDEFWISLLKRSGTLLEYIKNQTPELCVLALEQNALALLYVKEEFLTEEICVLAVKKYGRMLQLIKQEFQTENICNAAVQQNGHALEFVKDELQTDELCMLAVKQNGWALQYAKNQTADLCIAAVQQISEAIMYVDCQYEDAVYKATGVFVARSCTLF